MVSAVLLTTGTSLATFSSVPYIIEIVQRKTKPRVISWLVWTILLGLTAVVSWQQHQISSAILSGTSMLSCLVVTVLATHYASFELTRLERYSLLGALIGICLWLVFDNPMLVLMATLGVDGIAYLPTYINGWHNPHHESMRAFVISAIGSGLVLLAAIVAHATSTGLIYPLYSTIFGSIMIGILIGRRQYSRRLVGASATADTDLPDFALDDLPGLYPVTE